MFASAELAHAVESADWERVDRAAWGENFKRVVKAAAAAVGLYEDGAIAEAIGRQRQTVAGWWGGAKPSSETLRDLSLVLQIQPEAMYRWVHLDGEPPDIRPSLLERETVHREARDWLESETPSHGNHPGRDRG